VEELYRAIIVVEIRAVASTRQDEALASSRFNAEMKKNCTVSLRNNARKHLPLVGEG